MYLRMRNAPADGSPRLAPFPNNYRTFLELASADKAYLHSRMNTLGAQTGQQIIRMAHSGGIDGNDGIPEEESCQFRRTAGLYGNQQKARFLPQPLTQGVRERHGLGAYAEVAPTHPPMGE